MRANLDLSTHNASLSLHLSTSGASPLSSSRYPTLSGGEDVALIVRSSTTGVFRRVH